jgi:hypothetical protein
LVLILPDNFKNKQDFHFKLIIQAGRVHGAAILSQMRTLDSMTISIKYEGNTSDEIKQEASRHIQMIS